ncbi:hypothetical protein PANDA_007915, partial [Ailuropoda melanoleuca]
SPVPVKERKLVAVKLGEMPSWVLMRDFTPKGTAGAFQKGHYGYHKYVHVKKGVSLAPAASVFFNYCRSYEELEHGRLLPDH